MFFAQSDQEIVESFSSLGWEDWLLAAGVLIIGLVIARILGRLATRALGKTGLNPFQANILGRIVSGVASVVAFTYALQSVGVSVGPLVGAIGIAGLALAFAFQDILENVIAGLLMLMRRPIAVGDEIATNDYTGTVTDMTLRAVELTTLDGETVYIPNAMVWKNPVTNLTVTPTRRSSVEVGVAYDTNLDQAKHVLEAAARQVAGVVAEPPAVALAVAFGASSIDFVVRYWHESPAAVEWRLRDEMTRAVKAALDDAGIEIPFPQRVIHQATDVLTS